ncbi:hypothetical protein I3842_04G036000 [Carya illinoinensis]|uniref:Uncharacterized protein n=1 Tax=Carya illinoinensis TaxID=32201 RepID=A0A922F559_CARIL|nr:hypothetical protein I3842_04G036000 [Carya illinoinensis]
MNNLRPDGHEQGAFLGLTIQHLVTIQTLIQVLVNLLPVQYQKSGSSPFETHCIIMSIFIGAVCVYFLALMEIFRPNPNASYHHAARLICYVSGILACTCLVMILFPTFG